MFVPKLRLAILASGKGTTATAIMEACNNGRLPHIRPACLITSRHNTDLIERFAHAGMPKDNMYVLHPRQFTHQDRFGYELFNTLFQHSIDLIGQYGWMLHTPKLVTDAYEGRSINQHPGPLDPGRLGFGGKGMAGLAVHAARLFFLQMAKRPQEDWWTEATAQRISGHYDTGALLNTRRLHVEPSDTPELLQQRLLAEEHEVQIKTLEDFGRRCVTEKKREKPLVEPHEEKIFQTAVQTAIQRFPLK